MGQQNARTPSQDELLKAKAARDLRFRRAADRMVSKPCIIRPYAPREAGKNIAPFPVPNLENITRDWMDKQRKIPLPTWKEPWFHIVSECDAPPEAVRQPQVVDIQRVVGEFFNVRRLDLISDRRTMQVVLPRQIAVYFTKKLTVRSLPEIGRHFGGRDHTTVLHAVRKIERLINADPAFAAKIDTLQKRVEATYA